MQRSPATLSDPLVEGSPPAFNPSAPVPRTRDDAARDMSLLGLKPIKSTNGIVVARSEKSYYILTNKLEWQATGPVHPDNFVVAGWRALRDLSKNHYAQAAFMVGVIINAYRLEDYASQKAFVKAHPQEEAAFNQATDGNNHALSTSLLYLEVCVLGRYAFEILGHKVAYWRDTALHLGEKFSDTTPGPGYDNTSAFLAVAAMVADVITAYQVGATWAGTNSKLQQFLVNNFPDYSSLIAGVIGGVALTLTNGVHYIVSNRYAERCVQAERATQAQTYIDRARKALGSGQSQARYWLNRFNPWAKDPEFEFAATSAELAGQHTRETTDFFLSLRDGGEETGHPVVPAGGCP